MNNNFSTDNISSSSEQQGSRRSWDDIDHDGPFWPFASASALPEEILALVFRNLATADFPGAALVCKSWASTIKKGIDGVIIVVSNDQANKTMMAYSTKHNRWQILLKTVSNPSLSASCFGMQMLRQGRYMYATCPDKSWDYCSMFRYDPYSDEDWMPMECRAPFGGFGLAATGGSLFFIGGKYGRVRVQICDPTQSEPVWKTLPNVLHANGRSNATALDGVVYTVGGFDAQSHPDTTTERYLPGSNSWEKVAPVNIGRWGTQVCAVGGAMYAVGGLSNCGIFTVPFVPEMSIEQYCPITNTWKIVTTMPTARTNFAIAVVEKSIYVLGGRSHSSGACFGDGTATNLVEIFDTESGLWSEGTSLPTPAFTGNVCASSFARFG